MDARGDTSVRLFNHGFDAQKYLALYAERFIAYFDKTAGNDINNLFKGNGEGSDRLLLTDDSLISILSDYSLLNDLHKKLAPWQLIVSEQSIHHYREIFRTYYFKPIATHPDWTAFLTKHPKTDSVIFEKISNSFFYFIFQKWIAFQSDPAVKKRLAPLLTILNSCRSDAMMCKELEEKLISKLRDELNEFFLSVFELELKVEDISERVKNKLTELQNCYTGRYENIKSILWNRIRDFLDMDMSISKHTSVTTKEKQKPSSAAKLNGEQRRAIKNEIAKGLLRYLSEQTSKEEREDKLHVLLTNIFNQLYLFVSKDKHKDYADLFIHVPDDVKAAYGKKGKREWYHEQRKLPASQSVGNLKDVKRSVVKESELISVSASVPRLTPTTPTLTRDDTFTYLRIPELRALPDEREDRVQPVSPHHRHSIHYRHDSFFSGPPQDIAAPVIPKEKVSEKNPTLMDELKQHMAAFK